MIEKCLMTCSLQWIYVAVMYCSEKCRIKSKLQCKKDLKKYPINQIHSWQVASLSLNIAGGVDMLLGLLADEEPKTIFDFDWSKPRNFFDKLNMLLVINSLSKNVRDPRTQMVSREVLLDFAPINEKLRSSEDQDLLLKFILDQSNILNSNCVDVQELVDVCYHPFSPVMEFSRHLPGSSYFRQVISYGLFPFTSLINHACYPNIQTVLVDNRLALVVERPIKAGEQIFRSYIGLPFQYSLEERRKHLEKYRFTCDCLACTNKYSVYSNLSVKDASFNPPSFGRFTKKAALMQFKRNCNYIEKNIKKHPSLEIAWLIYHNNHLLHCLARFSFDD